MISSHPVVSILDSESSHSSNLSLLGENDVAQGVWSPFAKRVAIWASSMSSLLPLAQMAQSSSDGPWSLLIELNFSHFPGRGVMPELRAHTGIDGHAL